jgi:hypothetical protein
MSCKHTRTCFILHLGNQLDIVNIEQIDHHAVELTWTTNEYFNNHVQIQYRSIHGKMPWTTVNHLYNHSTTTARLSNLHAEQTYKFRLLALDADGQHIMSSSMKRLTMKIWNPLPVPQITDAWITTDGQVSLKWKLNATNIDNIDGFIIFYRVLNINENNYTKITVPNLRHPLIDTYTIASIASDNKYELRMATYSNRGTSPMSTSIEISIPSRKSLTNDFIVR